MLQKQNADLSRKNKAFPGKMRRFANIFLICIIFACVLTFLLQTAKVMTIITHANSPTEIRKNVEIFIFNWFESNDVWYLRKYFLKLKFQLVFNGILINCEWTHFKDIELNVIFDKIRTTTFIMFNFIFIFPIQYSH